MRPIAIDLYCGLGGWSDGLLAESYDVIGFDVERHVYGDHCYPAQLVLQDVLTLDGQQFRDAALIVASPPCQEFSYMAMPWTRAKQIAKALRGQCDFPEGYTGSRTVTELTALFDACFRIQKEASEAAGRHIPMVVENVRGAQPWVGRARWNFGSYYLWGDVPALMPTTMKGNWKHNPDGTDHGPGSWFAVADSKNRGELATKNTGGSWFNIGSPGQKVTNQNPVHDGAKLGGALVTVDGHKRIADKWRSKEGQTAGGMKHGGDWFNDPSSPGRQGGVKHSAPGTRANGEGSAWFESGPAASGSKSPARKMASAMIAKIPLALARHIARVYRDAAECAA